MEITFLKHFLYKMAFLFHYFFFVAKYTQNIE